jgi:transposase InsO family protein
MMHVTSEIINSAQEAQYRCAHWIYTLTTLGITVSMDGRGRATDNIYIELWFRTLKQRYVFMNLTEKVQSFRDGMEDLSSAIKIKDTKALTDRNPFSCHSMQCSLIINPYTLCPKVWEY